MHGEDDYPDDDRILKTTNGRGVLLPSSLRNMTEEHQALYMTALRFGLQLQHLEMHLRDELVPELRSAGVSWSAIGAALGITGEGARKRYES